MTTPGDESRTELAWREIVEHYGERAVLPDEPSSQVPDDAAAGTPEAASAAGFDAAAPADHTAYDDGPDDEADDLHAGPGSDGLREPERFHPPAAPPFPRPRTWQRGLAWAGVFVAPVLALLIGLFSLGLPRLAGWTMVAWFVGGFLYLVREMPRAPRDPWDDGSRV